MVELAPICRSKEALECQLKIASLGKLKTGGGPHSNRRQKEIGID